jgi:hypothetical protein
MAQPDFTFPNCSSEEIEMPEKLSESQMFEKKEAKLWSATENDVKRRYCCKVPENAVSQIVTKTTRQEPLMAETSTALP